MNKLLVSTIATSVLALAAADASACGETLFRTGQGMRYNAYAAPLPAMVLLYSNAAGATASIDSKLRKGLEKAGHKVTVVSDAEGFSAAAGTRPFDVVIADLAAIEGISAAIEAKAAKPDFVPVIERGGASTERELRERFAWCVREGAGLAQYLKAINKVMEVRAK